MPRLCQEGLLLLRRPVQFHPRAGNCLRGPCAEMGTDSLEPQRYDEGGEGGTGIEIDGGVG